MNWYYEQNGQRQGPVPESELTTLLANGTITPQTLVWKEGMENWAALQQVWTPPTSGGSSAGAAPGEVPPEGWIKCTATGKYFAPSEIVYIDGKPYSAGAKAQVLQGVMQSGTLPAGLNAERNGPPWERRAELGLVKAGWETCKEVLGNPSESFARMKREGGLGGPLVYPLIFSSLGGLVSLAVQFLMNMGTQSMIPAEIQGQQHIPSFFGFGFTIGFFLILAVLMPVFIALNAVIGSGILHLSLMICGGAKQGYETTFRTYCYVQGSIGFLQLVPFCGGLVAGIWGLVSMCIGLTKTQEISTGKAVLAVFLPTMVCCVVIVLFVGAFVGMGVAAQNAGH